MATTFLDEILEGWRFARDGVIEELENIPADSFGFRPTPATRSVAELSVHLIESGQMMAGELARTDGDFTRQPYADFQTEYGVPLDVPGDKASLIRLLRESHEAGVATLRAAGEARLREPIVQFNGVPASRLSWMCHGIAHEEYHRGQLALYARLLGLVPALTQRIEGA